MMQNHFQQNGFKHTVSTSHPLDPSSSFHESGILPKLQRQAIPLPELGANTGSKLEQFERFQHNIQRRSGVITGENSISLETQTQTHNYSNIYPVGLNRNYQHNTNVKADNNNNNAFNSNKNASSNIIPQSGHLTHKSIIVSTQNNHNDNKNNMMFCQPLSEEPSSMMAAFLSQATASNKTGNFDQSNGVFNNNIVPQHTLSSLFPDMVKPKQQVVPERSTLSSSASAAAFPAKPVPSSAPAAMPIARKVRKTAQRIPCKARGIKGRHDATNSYIEIPPDCKHGTVLTCSNPQCVLTGRLFQFCTVCQLPVSKANFAKRHAHEGSKYLKQNSGAAEEEKLQEKIQELEQQQQQQQQLMNVSSSAANQWQQKALPSPMFTSSPINNPLKTLGKKQQRQQLPSEITFGLGAQQNEMRPPKRRRVITGTGASVGNNQDTAFTAAAQELAARNNSNEMILSKDHILRTGEKKAGRTLVNVTEEELQWIYLFKQRPKMNDENDVNNTQDIVAREQWIKKMEKCSGISTASFHTSSSGNGNLLPQQQREHNAISSLSQSSIPSSAAPSPADSFSARRLPLKYVETSFQNEQGAVKSTAASSVTTTKESLQQHFERQRCSFGGNKNIYASTVGSSSSNNHNPLASAPSLPILRRHVDDRIGGISNSGLSPIKININSRYDASSARTVSNPLHENDDGRRDHHQDESFDVDLTDIFSDDEDGKESKGNNFDSIEDDPLTAAIFDN